MNFRDFSEKLRERLLTEYDTLLRPFNLAGHATSLASGKLMRTNVVYAMTGEKSEYTLDLCVALEMLHASTLVHDDIIDRASLRRGLPTIYYQNGEDQAILVGNMIATRAFRIVSEYDSQLAGRYMSAYQRVNEAQEYEIIERNNKQKTIQRCLDIYDGKTSAMFELPVWISRYILGMNDNVERLIEAMKYIGFAFQIVDDIEDLEKWLHPNGETQNVQNKSAKYDIELGDYTLPILYVLSTEDYKSDDDWYLDVPSKVWNQAVVRAEADAKSYLRNVYKITESIESSAMTKGLISILKEYEENLIIKGVDGARVL